MLSSSATHSSSAHPENLLPLIQPEDRSSCCIIRLISSIFWGFIGVFQWLGFYLCCCCCYPRPGLDTPEGTTPQPLAATTVAETPSPPPVIIHTTASVTATTPTSALTTPVTPAMPTPSQTVATTTQTQPSPPRPATAATTPPRPIYQFSNNSGCEWSFLQSDDAVHYHTTDPRLSLNALARQFQELGGRIHSLIDIDVEPQFNGGHSVYGSDFPIIPPGDTRRIYPVCPDGQTISQLMYKVLTSDQRPAEFRNRIHDPHGAISSVDRPVMPRNADWVKTVARNVRDGALNRLPPALDIYSRYSRYDSVERYASHIHCPKRPRAFETRVLEDSGFRQGMDLFVNSSDGTWELNPHAQATRDFMSNNYFLPGIRDGAVVLAANESVHAMLYRYVEVALRNPAFRGNPRPLTNVYLVPIRCAIDPITAAREAADSTRIRTFEGAMNIIVP